MSKELELAKKLNTEVFKVIGNNDALIGFEKAFLIATAAEQLKSLLTPEYMRPIMALQNNRLGFNTISGAEVGDGDVQDIDYKVAPDTKQTPKNPERDRLAQLVKEAKTLKDLETLAGHVVEFGLVEEYSERENELKAK